ncbi:MAG: hypothetical protein ACOYMG_11225 [Candidatus Methylumidiphilus sp.]
MTKSETASVKCVLAILLLGIYSVSAAEPTPTAEKKVTPMEEEQPKRRAPKPVPPARGKSVRYEVVSGAKARGFGQDGGVIAAVDNASGKELWTLTVYQTGYDPNEEEDVQEVYITRLRLNRNESTLMVENESRKSYAVNLSNREVSVSLGK